MIIGTLDRFGYDLTVIEETEAKARTALMKEYKRAFKDINGFAPSKDYINNANDDIEILELETGKVEWR